MDNQTDAPNDAGEPQTMFIHPAQGGSYRRNPDGSLTLVEKPTAPPAPEPSAQQPTE